MNKYSDPLDYLIEYNDQTNVVPLYSNKPEFIEWLNDSKSKQ